MPFYFNQIEKILMKGLNIAPAPIVDIAGGFSFFAIDAAISMNLFEILAETPLSLSEVAGRCGSDPRGLVTLLDLLKSLGYINEKNSMYSITRMTRKWLLNSSKVSFKMGFEYYKPTVTDIWPFIADSLKAGTPHINFYEWLKDKPETAEVYQKYMVSLAKMIIPELADKITLKEKRILDIGGSHGMYSIALCNKYPSLTVTIIDSEYAMPVLKQNIISAGLENRISLITGDILNYTFNEKFDAALLFNVFHEHNGEYNKKLSSRIAGVLNPSGRLVVLESLKKKNILPLFDFFERVYGLMFFHFLGGQNYTFNEIKSWFDSTVYGKVKMKSLYKSGFSLISVYLK